MPDGWYLVNVMLPDGTERGWGFRTKPSMSEGHAFVTFADDAQTLMVTTDAI